MTEFVARAKDQYKNWVYGAAFKHINRQPCPISDKITEKDISYYIIKSGFADWNMPTPIDCVEVNKDGICWQCPETPYFEHDILKVVDEFNDEIIGDVFFYNGAFLFALEEDNWITIPNLMEMGYEITLLGNSIDNPELLQGEDPCS